MPMQTFNVRDLISRAHELGASILHGQLVRHTGGGWSLEGRTVDDWLAEFDTHEIYLVVMPTDAVAAGQTARRTCHTCGRDYQGSECPHCREARLRLRGR